MVNGCGKITASVRSCLTLAVAHAGPGLLHDPQRPAPVVAQPEGTEVRAWVSMLGDAGLEPSEIAHVTHRVPALLAL